MKSLVAHGMHYIQNGDGEAELYDIEKEYSEEHNLALNEEARSNLQEFSEIINQFPPYARYRAAGR